jgi:hypothetical protein
MQQYAQVKYLKYHPGIIGQQNDIKEILKVFSINLMQSCNYWISVCLDCSFTCAFMAANLSVVLWEPPTVQNRQLTQ